MPAEAPHTQLCARLLFLPKPGRERELTKLMPSNAELLLEAHSPTQCLYFSSWPKANSHTEQHGKHIYNICKSEAKCSWTGKLKGIPFPASSSWASIALKLKWLGHYQQQNHCCKEFIPVSAFQYSTKLCWNWSSDQLLPCSLGGWQTPRRPLRFSLQPAESHVPYKQLAALNWPHLWYLGYPWVIKKQSGTPNGDYTGTKQSLLIIAEHFLT